MPEIHIDRLTLQLGGLSERDGRRLARLVADGLAGTPIAQTGERRAESVRVDVPARPDANLNRLAEQIVAEVLRQLT